MNERINRIKMMFDKSPNKVVYVENEKNSDDLLKSLNIDEKSVIGQVMFSFSKLCVNGYLRILSGDKRIELNIVEFNKVVKSNFIEGKQIFAYDVWGGLFAVSTNNQVNDESNIFYFAPDTLEWEDLDMNYLQFLMWVCTEEFNEFHESFMWSEIYNDFSTLGENDAILIYPFLWANECDLETASKKHISIIELVMMNDENSNKLV